MQEKNVHNIFILIHETKYSNCWSEFLATDPDVPGSIPGATTFFWEVVGLERSPFSLVTTIEEPLERKSSGSGLETEITDVGIRHADHVTLYPQKLALSSPASGGRSVGIICSRTQATEFLFFFLGGVRGSRSGSCESCHLLEHSAV
jgi:hypothetical protein